MFASEFMRNALLAGSFVALACGVCGWFVVLRGQVFAGDALGHVSFPGALAAAAAGVDERVGLFAATVAAGGAMGLLGLGVVRGRSGAGPGSSEGGGAQDTTIGVLFTFILALGVFFLARFSHGSGGSAGIVAARTLFGSIFGLGVAEARLAALIAIAALAITATIGRPLLFASLSPEVAAARRVPTRLLGVGFLALLGVVAAEASQAVGALLLLGLLTGPAAAAHRLSRGVAGGIVLAGGLALATMWAGLTLAYEIPSLPPGSAVIALCVGVYVISGALVRVRGTAAGGAHR